MLQRNESHFTYFSTICRLLNTRSEIKNWDTTFVLKGNIVKLLGTTAAYNLGRISPRFFFIFRNCSFRTIDARDREKTIIHLKKKPVKNTKAKTMLLIYCTVCAFALQTNQIKFM